LEKNWNNSLVRTIFYRFFVVLKSKIENSVDTQFTTDKHFAWAKDTEKTKILLASATYNSKKCNIIFDHILIIYNVS
jgi:hypothetical protein